MIETAAAIGAAGGSLFVTSLKRRTRFIAFTVWFFVNIYWIYHFYTITDVPLIQLYSFYLGTAIYGMYNNRPLKQNWNTTDTFWSE